MEITVEQLIERLKAEPPKNIINFCGLDFYRLDDKGDVTVFEFYQSIYRDLKGVLHVQDNQSSEK